MQSEWGDGMRISWNDFVVNTLMLRQVGANPKETMIGTDANTQ